MTQTVEINEGDVVKLRSGGPKMTVVRIGDLGCHVIWYVDDKKKKDVFPAAALTVVQEESE